MSTALKSNIASRLQEIDSLRGLAIFVMILIHTNAYFLSVPFSKFLWDICEFAVATFIFCASYVFFRKPQEITWANSIGYLKKRFSRLLIPYFIFVGGLFLLILYRQPQKLTPDYIKGSLTLTGGVDINWLVLLFLMFSLLFPILYILQNKNRLILYFYTAICIGISILSLFMSFPFNWKWIMVFPWSLVIIYTLFFFQAKNQQKYMYISTAIFFIIFISTLFLQISLHHSILQFDNKYPPNIYHLSYSLFGTGVLYLLFKNKLLDFPLLNTFLNFLSHFSYSLYFIHYLVIYYLSTFTPQIKFNWITFFLATITLTCAVQWSWNQVRSRLFAPKAII